MPSAMQPSNKRTNDIVVIIPVWNGLEYLPKCLAALSRQRAWSFDIVAVDNGSVDGSADYIESEWPAVHLIRNAANVGVAVACNLALAAAPGYATYVLLHQDTEPLPDWLVHLVSPLRRNPSIGIAGSKALFPNGTIQQAGARVDSRGVGHPIGSRQPDRRQFNAPNKAEYVGDASLAISRQALDDVGPMDGEFSPAFYEDLDWCYRVRNAGFHVVYAPKSRFMHYTAGVAGDEFDAIAYHRNRLRFLLKHWSLHRLVDDFIPAEQRWLAGLDARRPQMERALHRAYLQQLLQLADIVSAREKAFPNDVEEVHRLAAVLLSLRTLYPAPARTEDGVARPLATPLRSAPEGTPRSYGSLRRGLSRVVRSPLIAPISRPLIRFSNQQQLAETLHASLLDTSREITATVQAAHSQAANRQPPQR